MRQRRRLVDEYQFPGCRPQATVRGIFGDPTARIVRLVRRQKNGVRGLWWVVAQLLRPQDTPGSRSAVWRHACVCRVRGATGAVSELSGGEAGEARVANGVNKRKFPLGLLQTPIYLCRLVLPAPCPAPAKIDRGFWAVARRDFAGLVRTHLAVLLLRKVGVCELEKFDLEELGLLLCALPLRKVPESLFPFLAHPLFLSRVVPMRKAARHLHDTCDQEEAKHCEAQCKLGGRTQHQPEGRTDACATCRLEVALGRKLAQHGACEWTEQHSR